MGDTVEVLVPVEREAAAALEMPGLREEIGRRVSEMLSHKLRVAAVREAMRLVQEQAAANGITEQIIEDELAAWRAERSAAYRSA